MQHDGRFYLVPRLLLGFLLMANWPDENVYPTDVSVQNLLFLNEVSEHWLHVREIANRRPGLRLPSRRSYIASRNSRTDSYA